MVSKSLEQVVKNAKSFAGNPEVNDMFWALHPGGAAILRQIESQLKLSPLKLKVCLQNPKPASIHVEISGLKDF